MMIQWIGLLGKSAGYHADFPMEYGAFHIDIFGVFSPDVDVPKIESMVYLVCTFGTFAM